MDAKKRGLAEEVSALHAEGKLDAAEKIYCGLVATEGSAQGYMSGWAGFFSTRDGQIRRSPSSPTV